MANENIHQVFVANPITTNAATDLIYIGQSPYGIGNDSAITYSNFAAQFGAPYTPAALSKTDDTNVTMTLGGTPLTALLHAASMTLGWTGQLSMARGGTNASLTAANGAIPYSSATAIALLAAGTTGQMFQSGGVGAPAWTTTTYPSTNAINTIMFASSSNVLGVITPVNSAVLISSAGGIPSMSTTLPAGLTIPGYQASLTLPLSFANGGTGAALTASNGGMLWSNATTAAILAGTATAGLALLSGATGAPSWSTSPPITQVKTQPITSTGTYTPSAGMVFCIAEIVGGGAGGGGANGVGATSSSMAGGGGGGGYCRKLYTAALLGASAAVVIGGAGAGGAAGNNPGGNGVDSTFTPAGAGAVLTASGGGGGLGGTATATTNVTQSGDGGAATGGDLNVEGTNGNRGATINGLAGTAIGGDGGGSFFSPNFVDNSSLGGQPAFNFGGGGCGGFGQLQTAGGGAGKTGICIITEFLSV